MPTPTAHVIAGGTHFHVRPHLALAAPAYGATGRALHNELETRGRPAALYLTAMAGGPKELDTNADVARLVGAIVADPATRLLFMPVALCDFTGSVLRTATRPPRPAYGRRASAPATGRRRWRSHPRPR